MKKIKAGFAFCKIFLPLYLHEIIGNYAGALVKIGALANFKKMEEQKKPKRKPAIKAAKDKRFFDPSEFARDKHPIQAWENRKGKQPEWVKQQYGANEAAG